MAGATLTIDTPPNTTFVSASSSPEAAPNPGGTGTVQWDVGDLPPGGSGNVILVVAVDDGTPAGTVISTAPYTLSGTVPAVTVSGVDVPVQVAGVSRMALAKSVRPDPATPGEPLTYTVTYSNPSATTLDDVVIAEQYGPAVTFVSAVPAPDVGTNNEWSVGDLAPGASGAVVITVRPAAVPDGTIIHNVATATASNGEFASATADSVIQAVPVVGLDLTELSLSSGGLVTYRLTYSNPGPNDLTGVVLRTSYDPALSFQSAFPAPDLGGTTEWTLGTLPIGAAGTIRIEAIHAVALAPGLLLQSIATVQDDAAHSAAARVVSPLSQPAAKFALLASPSHPLPGTIGSYTLRLRNMGKVTLDNVELAFQVPPDTTCLGVSAATPTTGSIRGLTFTIPYVAPGRGAAIRFQAKVSASAPVGTLISGVATATGPGLNTMVATTTSVVRPVPGSGVKAAIVCPKEVARGSRTTCTVALKIKSRGVLTNLELRNQLPVQFTYQSAAPAPSKSSKAALIWDLGTVEGSRLVRVTVGVEVAADAVPGQVVTNSVTVSDAQGYSASAIRKVVIR